MRAADQVGVRAQAELAGEAAHQVRDAAVERGGRPREADLAGHVIVEELPELPGDAWFRSWRRVRRPGQVTSDPIPDQREPGLGIQALRIGKEAIVQP